MPRYSCYYEESGHGKPLLFLHGNASSSKMFWELAPAFSNHYKTVLIDFSGHEKSDCVKEFATDLWYDEALQAFVRNVRADREESKKDADGAFFYQAMHGDGWEEVVDCDTDAIARHAQTIGRFFHKPLEEMRAEILPVGSREDEYVRMISPQFYDRTYEAMIKKMGRGRMCLFETGRHPAALSNQEEFRKAAVEFLESDLEPVCKGVFQNRKEEETYGN